MVHLQNKKLTLLALVFATFLVFGLFGCTSSQKDVRALVDEARSQNRLSEFGTDLATNGSKESVTTLLTAIDLVQGDEKETLARSLQALQSSDASAELQDFLVKDANNAVVAVQARDALARIAKGNEVIRISQAIEAINTPEQGLARSYLLGVLGRVRNDAAVPSLISVDNTTTNSAVYTSVSIALGGIGTPEAVSGLVDIIEKKGIVNTNDPAVQALASVQNKDSLEELQKAKATSSNSAIQYAVNLSISNIEKQANP